MENYRVEHNRRECIACGACVAVSPGIMEIDPSDGKSDLKGAERLENGSEKREIGEKDFPSAKEAADVCPVNVIHIFKKTGEKII